MRVPLPRRPPSLLALSVAALLVSGIGTASAADWPTFRPGQWQFERTMESPGKSPEKVTTTTCMDPTAENAKQRQTLTKAGCKFSPLTQSGTTYSYRADCDLGGVKSTSSSVLTAKGADAYTIAVESVVNGAKSRETLTARRLGECPR